MAAVIRNALKMAVWSTVLPVIVAGCGSSDRVRRGEVRGTVRVEGRPLTAGTVFFENAGAGVAVSAAIQADGRYEVRTYEGSGLPVGTYRVAVTAQRLAETDANPLAGDPRSMEVAGSVEIPARYRRASTSELTITVAAGANGNFDFDLQP